MNVYPVFRLKDNAKIDLNMGYEDANWIKQAQDNSLLYFVVNAVMSLRVPQITKFLDQVNCCDFEL